MQINLPDDATPLIRQKAAAAGFADQIDAYVAHLIASDDIEDYRAPDRLSLAGKSREEIESMIDADWRKLHKRVDLRSR